MNILLKKEAWHQITCNSRLEVPHLRKTPYKPRPQVKSFGFSVPITLPPKPQPRTRNYYFGNISQKPAGKYEVISDGTRTNAVTQMATKNRPLNTPDSGTLKDMKAIDYFSQYIDKRRK